MNTMTVRKIILILSSAFLLCSCKEQMPFLFEDINGVYFNNRTTSGVLVDSTSVTFVYEDKDMMEIPVNIHLLGRISDNPRDISLSVYSENAEEGVDYILPGPAVIPGGADEFDYVVTLLRTPGLKTGSKTITMQLSANEMFSLPVTGENNASGKFVTALTFRIIFSDMFTEAPEAWEDEILGIFSQQKFELACAVLDISPSDFNDPAVMTLARSVYVSQEMTRYISEQVDKKNNGTEYDENAFDRETGEPLSFA